MELRTYIINKITTTPKLAELYTKKDEGNLPKRRFYFSLEKKCRNFINGYVKNKTIILPGLRGTGKTTAMLQLYRYLTEKKGISRERVLYISLDEVVELIGSSLYDVVLIYINEVLNEAPESLEKKVFILIDEAHFDKQWQTAVKVLHDRSIKMFIAVTGSSSIAIEMTPDLVRRVVKETVYPLNFSEYLLLKYNFYPPRGTAASLRKVIFEGDFNNLKKLYDSIRFKIADVIPTTVLVEFQKYLNTGGFAFGLELEKGDIYKRVWEIIEKIVRVDLPAVTNLKTESIPVILRLITFLAIQKPGGVSINDLASKLGVSSATVSAFLDALEKTHLLFKVLPSDGAGVKARKPWKYYFATPTVNAAINNLIGGLKSEEETGIMLETLVASYLKRSIETLNLPYVIFYDAEKRGVDFVLEHLITGSKIPIEVTSSVKGSDLKKVYSAISKFKSKYGVLITLKGEFRIEDNVVVIPAPLFSFL